MFNDFKIRTYSTTQNKLRVLKDIFDRLNLFNFEKRLNSLMFKVEVLKNIKKVINENPPSIPSTPAPSNTYIIIHAHNDENKEIAPIVGVEYLATFYPSVKPGIPFWEIPPEELVSCIFILQNAQPFLYNDLFNNYFPLFYIDNILIDSTAIDELHHNEPLNIANYGLTPGIHNFKVIFNGITQQISVNLTPNSINTLTFNFSRTFAPSTPSASGGTTWENSDYIGGGPMWVTQDVPGDTSGDNWGAGSVKNSPAIASGSFSLSLSATAFFLTLSASLEASLPFWCKTDLQFHGLPFNVAIQNFNYWYCQVKSSGFYPAIIWFAIPPYNPRVIIHTENNPNIPIFENIISAKDEYTSLFVAPNQLFECVSTQGTVHFSGSLIDLYISSVPFDIRGISF